MVSLTGEFTETMGRSLDETKAGRFATRPEPHIALAAVVGCGSGTAAARQQGQRQQSVRRQPSTDRSRKGSSRPQAAVNRVAIRAKHYTKASRSHFPSQSLGPRSQFGHRFGSSGAHPSVDAGCPRQRLPMQLALGHGKREGGPFPNPLCFPIRQRALGGYCTRNTSSAEKSTSSPFSLRYLPVIVQSWTYGVPAGSGTVALTQAESNFKVRSVMPST